MTLSEDPILLTAAGLPSVDLDQMLLLRHMPPDLCKVVTTTYSRLLLWNYVWYINVSRFLTPLNVVHQL